MNKKFVINLGLLLLLNFLIKPFYILGIDAEIQTQVGEEIYGKYFSLLGLSFLLNIVLDVGIVNYNTRNIAQHQFLLQKYFGYIIGIRLLLSVLYIAVTILAAILLGYQQQDFVMLGWLVFNQILASLILYIRSNLGGLLLFKQDSIVSVLDRAILILICGALLWGGITQQTFDIYWFVYSQTLAYGITLLIAIIFLIKKSKLGLPKMKRSVSVSILKKSFPYALLILLMTIYYRSDSVMLERMLPDGDYQAGIYAKGFRFFEAANNIALLFATLLLPLFSSLIKNKGNVLTLVGLSSRVLLSGAMVVSFVCFMFQQEILGLRYENEPIISSQVFGLLMLCFFFISCTYIFGTLLTANGNLNTLNKIAFGGALLNIILNFILIPTHKAYGAALASLITQALTSLAQMLLCVKYFNIKVNLRVVMGFSLLTLIGTTLTFLIFNIHLTTGSFLYDIFISLAIFALAIFLLGIIGLDHVKKIIALAKRNNGA